MVLQKLARTYERQRDYVWLSIYFLIMLASGVVVGRMVGSAFSGYSGFKRTFKTILNLTPVELINLAALGLGFYLGLVLLLFLDFKKRVQSLLMIIGTVLGSVIIAIEGVLFFWMSALDFALVIIAFLLTLGAVGGKTLREIRINPDSLWSGILTNQNDEPVEFRSAATYIKTLVMLFISLSFFEAHTTYLPLLVMDGPLQVNNIDAFNSFRINGSETQLGVNLLFSFLLIAMFNRFLDYEASRRVVFIGPPRSGKTHTIIALYTEAQNSDFNARNPSRYLTRQKNFLTRNRDWIPETELEVHKMGFVYSTKGLFSKNVTIDGLDYPGEYVYYMAKGLEYVNAGMRLPSEPVDDELPESINLGSNELIGEQIEEEVTAADPWASALIDNASEPPPDSNHATFEDAYVTHIRTAGPTDSADQTASNNPDQVYVHMIQSVLPRVINADTLAFVFDVNQAIEFKKGDDAKYIAVEQYNKIAGMAYADRHFGIATKSDLLSYKFQEEMRYRPSDAPEVFQSFVENELLNTPFSDQIENLQLDLYPVYLETEGDGDNARPRIPVRPYGTKKLLQEFGRK